MFRHLIPGSREMHSFKVTLSARICSFLKFLVKCQGVQSKDGVSNSFSTRPSTLRLNANLGGCNNLISLRSVSPLSQALRCANVEKLNTCQPAYGSLKILTVVSNYLLCERKLQCNCRLLFRGIIFSCDIRVDYVRVVHVQYNQ